MTLHAIISYIRYRRKAKTRHGIHSPFVYSFIDDCLRAKYDKSLAERIHEYFKADNIMELGGSPENILHFFNQLSPDSDTIIVIKGIYQTKEHTAVWKTISENTPAQSQAN